MPVRGTPQSADARRRISDALAGEKNPKAKLTDAQVLEIAILRETGMSFNQIAARYGVTKFCIYYAVKFRGPGIRRRRREYRPG
jgi:hypothetical protein